jgi:hypothetical protein
MRLLAMEYQAPARIALRIRSVRLTITAYRQRLAAFLERTASARAITRDWLAGLALVLAYLCLSGWMEREDLRDRLNRAEASSASARARAMALQRDLDERRATDGGDLFYLIEGGSTREVQDKLQRLGMMIGARHYSLYDIPTPEAK